MGTSPTRTSRTCWTGCRPILPAGSTNCCRIAGRRPDHRRCRNGVGRQGDFAGRIHWREVDAHIAWCDQRIAEHLRGNTDVQRAAQLIGIGPVTASAVVGAVGDFHQFRSGAQFGAWLGLVPRQHSSGGKSSLGSITKHGQTYLRMLLVQGAKSAVMTAQRRDDRISRWALALRERAGWQKAVVALANKNARILWAVMTRGERFNPDHLSVKPG